MLGPYHAPTPEDPDERIAVPAWIDHAIWWQVYPLGFAGADDVLDADQSQATHGLQRLVGWLDHLVELGGNGLLLGPLFTSMSHGYDTLDYFTVDPRLGTNDDLQRLITEAKRRGIRVVLDGVFNHVGRDFPKAQEAISGGPDSEAGRWLKWSEGSDGKDYPYTFEGHEQLVTLNHDEPAVQQFVGDVLRHWLGQGVDGWRLDAAYAVPAEFWAAVVPGVREQFGDAWLVGEMIHGDYAAYAGEAGLDSITQYELWSAIWSSVEHANFFELDWTLGRHRLLLESLVPMTFLSNHDTSRVASQIADPRHLPHAVVLLGFLPGVPSIYYGDDFGLRAVKENRAGGDDAVRPELPPERGLYAGGDSAIEQLYRDLIGLRRRTPWLVDAEIRTEQVANQHIRIVATPRSGGDTPLTLTLNLADASYALPAGATVVASGALERNRVAPHSWAITS